MSIPLSPATLKVLEDFCNDTYTSQSEMISGGGQSATTKENIVTFVDSSIAPSVGATSGNNVFSCKDMTIDTSISDFFSRPVRINSFTWNESDTIGIVSGIFPWKVWAQNQFVSIKLNNYAWFRGDLKLKIQVTASPFYYGMMKVVSQPLHNFTPSTINNDAGTRYLIPMSQRPHITLIPGEATSYEFTIPFIYPTNWLNIQSAQAFEDMGTLQYFVWSQLQSANGVSSAGISVVTYAWIENLELSGASVGYAAQSDEYGDGVISKPASAIANAAGALKDLPIIGPFATATEIGAKAVSSIARIFGFTNVPVIADTMPVRNEQFPKLASADIGYPVEKFTTDPKCELSVDPRIVGLADGEDELTIVSLCKRESWLCRSTWSTSQVVDTLLFQSRINPFMFDYEAGAGAAQSKLYTTPMGFVSNCFDHWRGTVIFRFHIVASKYHKGRLLINFDPSGYSAQNIGSTVATSGVVHTSIIDIGETQDVEFHVPYQQAAQFLTVRPGYTAADRNWTVSTTPNWNYSPLYDNGFLTIRILNNLTAPVASSSVDIQIFVRAAEDIEFANPTEVDLNHKFSFYTQQSEILTENVSAESVLLAPTMEPDDQQYLVHYGERILSMRQLLRRYDLHTIEGVVPSVTPNTVSTLIKKVFKMPMSPGYCTAGYYQANGLNVPLSTFNYNWCNFTMLSYLSSAFLCYRGSTSWSFNFNSQSKLMGHIRTFRDNQAISGTTAAIGTAVSTVGSFNKLAKLSIGRPSGRAGTALINANTQSGMNVQIPNMSPYKFCSTATANANSPVVNDGSILDGMVLEADFGTSTSLSEAALLYTYVAAGTDFNLHYFLNTPTILVYSGIPVAP